MSIKATFQDLDNPIEFEDRSGFWKWGKYEILIIYPDASLKKYHKKLKKTYKIVIKGKVYIILPDCIVRGKRPLLAYYYNNPNPIQFKHSNELVSSEMLYRPDELEQMPIEFRGLLAKIKLDSSTLNNLFTTNIVKGLYPITQMTTKNILIFVGVGFVMILIILQFTGVVDIMSLFVSGRG